MRHLDYAPLRLGHGLRPMTVNIKKLRSMQAWAKLFIFTVAWLIATAKIISLRTVEHDELPLSRTARVFELFSLDTPGFSGFLPLSYPVCGP